MNLTFDKHNILVFLIIRNSFVIKLTFLKRSHKGGCTAYLLAVNITPNCKVLSETTIYMWMMCPLHEPVSDVLIGDSPRVFSHGVREHALNFTQLSERPHDATM